MRPLTQDEYSAVEEYIRTHISAMYDGKARITDLGVRMMINFAYNNIDRIRDPAKLGERIFNTYMSAHAYDIPSDSGMLEAVVQVHVPQIAIDGTDTPATSSNMDALAPLVQYIQSQLASPKVDIDALRADIDSAVQGMDASLRADVGSALADIRAELKRIQEQAPRTIEIKTEREIRKINGRTHPVFPRVLGYLSRRVWVYLYGPAGTGKSHMASQLAEALGVPFYPSGAPQTKYELTGFANAQGVFVKETAPTFYKAYVNGGLFFIDEADGGQADAMLILNGALSNGTCEFPDGVHEMHPDFYCVCAGNTAGRGADSMYCGRSQIDSATLDRFAFVHVDYDSALELELAGGDKGLVRFVHQVRDAVDSAQILYTVTYRAIEDMHATSDMTEATLAERIKDILLRGLPKEDMQTIYDALPASEYKEAMASLI